LQTQVAIIVSSTSFGQKSGLMRFRGSEVDPAGAAIQQRGDPRTRI
jgi:hypothetical protein